MVAKERQLREYLQQIRQAVDGLERLLARDDAAATDPHVRRRDLLEGIYLREGVEKGELLPSLRDAGTTYQWIGQQVKRGYLAVTPLPTGKVRYTVTPKAVRELELNKMSIAEEAAAYTAMAQEAFAEDWDSREDAIYDRL